MGGEPSHRRPPLLSVCSTVTAAQRGLRACFAIVDHDRWSSQPRWPLRPRGAGPLRAWDMKSEPRICGHVHGGSMLRSPLISQDASAAGPLRVAPRALKMGASPAGRQAQLAARLRVASAENSTSALVSPASRRGARPCQPGAGGFMAWCLQKLGLAPLELLLAAGGQPRGTSVPAVGWPSVAVQGSAAGTETRRNRGGRESGGSGEVAATR